MEEVPGGALGDLAITQIGLWLGIPFIIITMIVIFFTYVFGDKPEDFIEAKASGKGIECTGLIKTYLYGSDEYRIDGEHIVIKKLLKDKRHLVADCDIN